MGFPGDSVVKNSPTNTGHMNSLPGSRKSPGEGNSNPLFVSSPRKILWTEEPGRLSHGVTELDMT